jgi:hypothetical protein
MSYFGAPCSKVVTPYILVNLILRLFGGKKKRRRAWRDPGGRTVFRRLMTRSVARGSFDSRHRTSRDVTCHVARLDHVE